MPTKEELASAVRAPALLGPSADRIRTALDKPFTYDCKEKATGEVLRDMNKAFQAASPGLLIKDGTNLGDGAGPALTAHFDQMPFGAALEWVEDSLTGSEVGTYRVVVRDYGVVMAPQDELPPGAPLLVNFWKGATIEDKHAPAGAKDQPANPPAKAIEGQVKYVDKDNRIHINIGKKDGLAKGDYLAAYRQDEKNGRPVFLTTLTVIEVDDSETLATLRAASSQGIEEGDRVYRIDPSSDPNK